MKKKSAYIREILKSPSATVTGRTQNEIITQYIEYSDETELREKITQIIEKSSAITKAEKVSSNKYQIQIDLID